MERGGDLMGLRIAQVRCCSTQRLPGGVLIPGTHARMAQQECGQIIGQFHGVLMRICTAIVTAPTT